MREHLKQKGCEVMKKLPIGIQNFREIIEDNHVYVDKTMYVHHLINNGKCYFLSRPRRFGKSLFLDTIAEVFKGNKELFKGLWIYETDYDFKSHPVVKLDISNISNKTPDIFEKSIAYRLRRLAEEEDIKINDETPSGLFSEFIERLFNLWINSTPLGGNWFFRKPMTLL